MNRIFNATIGAIDLAVDNHENKRCFLKIQGKRSGATTCKSCSSKPLRMDVPGITFRYREPESVKLFRLLKASECKKERNVKMVKNIVFIQQ